MDHTRETPGLGNVKETSRGYWHMCLYIHPKEEITHYPGQPPLGAKESVSWVCCLKYKPRQKHYFANKSPSSQIYGFSSSHVWMWEMNHKESCHKSKGGMIWENSTETCILSYVKQIASPGSMHETWCSVLVHWDDPDGWDGEAAGSGAQDGEHMCTHGWFMSMYGKTTTVL